MQPQDEFRDGHSAGNRFSKGVGAVAVAAMLFVAAVVGGAGKLLRNNGGKLGRGVVAAQAFNRHLNPAPLPSLQSRMDELSREAARLEAARVGAEVQALSHLGQGLEFEGADLPGLPQDARAASAIEDKLSGPAIRKLCEESGLSVRIACAPYRMEYRGQPNKDLDLVATTGVTKLTFNLGPHLIDQWVDADTLPNIAKGEYNKCRVRFGNDGRAFLSMSGRFFPGDDEEPIEFKGHYELEVIRGTEEQFNAGKPVLFGFSERGLKRNEQDCVSMLERLVTPAIHKRLADDALLSDLANRLKVSTNYQHFSTSMILATPAQIVTEDGEESVATVRATFPPK